MSLKQSAQDVLNLIERGAYDVDGTRVSIATACQQAISGSRLYTPDALERLRATTKQGRVPIVEVVPGTTQQVAQTLAAEGPLMLLNFASARNPGGGFLNGAKAQEEDLCRCSALYPTLVQHTEYYDANRAQKSLLYTDHMIFSPDVPFFKTLGTGRLLAKPFQAAVLTAPAPNSRPYFRKAGDPRLLEECFERRWSNVLVSTVAEQHSTLLLGAWGCGAFGGDPLVASRTARKAIDNYGAGLERIVFAIPDRGRQSQYNLEVFQDQLTS